jgi:hypothetical protein
MLSLCAHRLLIVLVALLFAAGHGHQVLGQFEIHHHHGLEVHALGEVHEHEGDEQHEDGEDPDQDGDHMLTCHAALAAVPADGSVVIVVVRSVRLVGMHAEAMPEAPVAGIDYPPQLVG